METAEENKRNNKEQPSQLALPTAIEAIQNSSACENEIGLIIFCGIKKDYSNLTTAKNIQEQLDLNTKYAFDISNGNNALTDSIKIVTSFFQCEDIEYALVCTGEIPYTFLKKTIDNINIKIKSYTRLTTLKSLSINDNGGAIIFGKSEISKYKTFH